MNYGWSEIVDSSSAAESLHSFKCSVGLGGPGDHSLQILRSLGFGAATMTYWIDDTTSQATFRGEELSTIRLDAPTMPRVVDPWIGTLLGKLPGGPQARRRWDGRGVRGEASKIGHERAVKILKRELALDEEYAQRFLNEARAVNIIRHPGLVESLTMASFLMERCFMSWSF